MAVGYNISRGRALCVLFTWVIITVCIALMVAYIPDHSCDDCQHDVAATATTLQFPSVTDDVTTQFPPQGDGPWMDPFLDERIRPVHYDLFMDPEFYHDGTTYYGRENITIEVGVDTEYLIVHYKYMNITNTRAWLEDGTELQVADTFAYDTHEYWVTSLTSAVPAGSVVVLHLEFHGSLVNGIVGYYKSTYVNQDTGVECTCTKEDFAVRYATNTSDMP